MEEENGEFIKRLEASGLVLTRRPLSSFAALTLLLLSMFFVLSTLLSTSIPTEIHLSVLLSHLFLHDFRICCFLFFETNPVCQFNV